MANHRLTQILANRSTRRNMFRAWQEKQSLRYVANVCSASICQVKRVKLLDDWDARLAVLQVQARAAADKADSSNLTRLITDVVSIRDKVIHRLKTLYDAETVIPTTFDLDRIVRLELFLKGHPDARLQISDPFQAIILAVQQYDSQHRAAVPSGSDHSSPLHSLSHDTDLSSPTPEVSAPALP